MANRWFNQFRDSLEKQVVELYVHATFGSTGAVTLDAAKSKGITSVSKTATGKYTFTLNDRYNRLLFAERTALRTSSPAAPHMYVTTNTVDSTTPTVVVQFTNTSSVATNPASGEEVFMRFMVSNTSAI